MKKDYKVPLISDIHNPEEAELASNVLDIIQIPAFLSRQTDLIEAACATSLPINIKKGQFLAPSDMNNILKKANANGTALVKTDANGNKQIQINATEFSNETSEDIFNSISPDQIESISITDNGDGKSIDIKLKDEVHE